MEENERLLEWLKRVQKRVDADLKEAEKAGPIDPRTEQIIRLTALITTA